MSPKLRHRVRNTMTVLFLDGRQFWITLIVLVVLLLAPRLGASSPETVCRHAGVLLQLAGLGVVAMGIHDTRRRFGRPSLGTGLKGWWAKLKNAWFMPPITAHGASTVSLSSIGTGVVTFAPTVTTTLEGRVKALEASVDDLQKGLARVKRESSETASEIRKALAEEGVARERSDSEVRLLIEDQAAGGLHLEVMGLVWLLVGTLLGWPLLQFCT